MPSPSRYDFSSIEGFLLVVHTSLGGDQLVFRYPPVTRTAITEETWTAVLGKPKPQQDKTPSDSLGTSGTLAGSSNSSNPKSSHKSAKEPPTSPNEPPISISYSEDYSPYDMPSVMICNIFSPKQSLCDKMFHVIIDQSRFFGFPTLLHKDQIENDQSNSQNIISGPSSKNTNHDESSYTNPIPFTNLTTSSSSSPRMYGSSTSNSSNPTSNLTSHQQSPHQTSTFLTPPPPSSFNISLQSLSKYFVAVEDITASLFHVNPDLFPHFDPITYPKNIQFISNQTLFKFTIDDVIKSIEDIRNEDLIELFGFVWKTAPQQKFCELTSITEQSLSNWLRGMVDFDSDRLSGKNEQQQSSRELLPAPAVAFQNFLTENLHYLKKQLMQSKSSQQPTIEVKSSSNSPQSNNVAQNQIKDELTMFNLVMSIPKDVGPEVALMGQRIAVQIASALKHEQQRCHYVSDEVFKMLRLREQWFHQHRRPNSDAPPPSHTALTYEILQHSSLAQLIKDVYHSLRDDGSIQKYVNGWIPLSLSTSIISKQNSKDPMAKQFGMKRNTSSASSPALQSSLQSSSSLLRMSATCPSPSNLALSLLNSSDSVPSSSQKRPIRPFHSLLIIDPEHCLSTLPVDCSPSLRKIVEHSKPTKSFRDMQIEFGISLPQLYRIASHLVYWKKAKIIDTLTRNNYYLLNPNPKKDENQYSASISSTVNQSQQQSSVHLPFLSQTFHSLFHLKLTDILQKFSVPRKLSDIMQSTSQHTKFVDMISWLLREDLIVQTHQFCYLLIPPSSKSFSNPASNYTSPESETADSTTSQLLLSPSPLTLEESIYLESLDNGSKEYKLFKKLCPYFRGAHHLTEIAWRENISKEELQKVIAMYKNVIVLVQHPEES